MKIHPAITRRSFLRSSAASSLTLLTPRLLAADLLKPTSPVEPIVRTSAGKVRGFLSRGVNSFRGIPYAAAPAGMHRFLPPGRPEPWTGIRDASQFGPMAYQDPPLTGIYADVLRGLIPEEPMNMSEDCLRLNVWSPELGSGHKRPVMVWLHPAGMIAWAGNSAWTDGTNLARNQDVVVVSLNHRLNAFGFLYLEEVAGPKYAESGNAGMLDIIAALRWVQENIAAFGGDPDNVTIFGESGGGWKVSALLAMPPARGLFHKAIAEFDVLVKGLSREQAASITTKVLRKLGIKDSVIDRLSRVSARQLLDAARDYSWVPVVAGSALPRDPFYPDAPSISSQIPLLLGTNRTETEYWVLSGDAPPFENDEALRKYLASHLRDQGVNEAQAGELIKIYRRLHPAASRLEIMVGASTAMFRDTARMVAELKLRRSATPVFLYIFGWEAQGFGGRYHTSHTFELPFVFDNVDAASQLFGPTPDPRRYQLARNVSGAWAAFAHRGNPSHTGIPEWKPYNLAHRPTMLLNYTCKLAEDPDREERAALERLRPARLPRIDMDYMNTA